MFTATNGKIVRSYRNINDFINDDEIVYSQWTFSGQCKCKWCGEQFTVKESLEFCCNDCRDDYYDSQTDEDDLSGQYYLMTRIER